MPEIPRLAQCLRESQQPLLELLSEIAAQEDHTDDDLWTLAVLHLELKEYRRSFEYFKKLHEEGQTDDMRAASGFAMNMVRENYAPLFRYKQSEVNPRLHFLDRSEVQRQMENRSPVRLFFASRRFVFRMIGPYIERLKVK